MKQRPAPGQMLCCRKWHMTALRKATTTALGMKRVRNCEVRKDTVVMVIGVKRFPNNTIFPIHTIVVVYMITKNFELIIDEFSEKPRTSDLESYWERV